MICRIIRRCIAHFIGYFAEGVHDGLEDDGYEGLLVGLVVLVNDIKDGSSLA